jgi:CDP-4-dehydro-6-deoxyglucose reductase
MPHRARILAVSDLADPGQSTQRIRLEIEGFHFRAGQYLEVLHPNGTRIPLSIASSPSCLPELELHYRSTPDNAEAAAMDELLTGQSLDVSDAAGMITCPSATTPLLVVAGGSGAALAFCLAAYRSEQMSQAQVVWYADRDDDIYDLERLRSSTHTLEVFIDARRTSENTGLMWLDERAADFIEAAIIITGSPPFVYAVTDTLLAQGIAQTQLQSDVYQYAPR